MSFIKCGSSLRALIRLMRPAPFRVSRRAELSTVSLEEPIIIPERIHRSNTDILKALAGTVGQDTSGPHYKYSDDPYLTPYSNLTKRAYALSKESGRKAARWIRESNPSLFTHTPDDPRIESLSPSPVYNDKTTTDAINSNTLQHVIHLGEVKNAIAVYEICKKREIEIEEGVLQSFLELLCFYNCEECLGGEWVEERWYKQTHAHNKKTWKDSGLAEEIFASLTTNGPNSKAYCALIRGMTQYLQVDRAWQLYEECQEKDIKIDTGTYNSLIRVAPLLRDDSELKWKLIENLLHRMSSSGTEPDIGTLNGTLEALSLFAGWRQARDMSLKVLAEFNNLGITASLSTFYYLLVIHCRERGPKSHILLDILDHLEKQQQQQQQQQQQHEIFIPRDIKDTYFFVTAMEVARNHVKNFEAAQRIDKIVNSGDNILLIGDSYKHSVYYRHYFALSCSSLSIDEFMKVYDRVVPHIYTPEPGVMKEVLDAVRVSGSLHYIPKLWSDMIIFDHTSQDRLVAATLSALSQHTPTPTELTGRLGTVAVDMWKRSQEQHSLRKRNKVTWTGQLVGELVVVLVNCGEYKTATEVLSVAANSPQLVLGVLPYYALQVLCKEAATRRDNETAVDVVLYSQDAGHQETGQMALLIHQNLALTPNQKAKIKSRLGGDILTTTATTFTTIPPPCIFA